MLDPSNRRASDADLIGRVAARDKEAFHELVERHRARVWRLARAMTHDEAAAEDALQEAMVSIWSHAGDFRGESAKGWIFTIVRNAVNRQLRRRREDPVAPEPLAALGEAAGWGASPDPEAAMQLLQDGKALARCIAALRPEDREVITLLDLEGLEQAEAARILGLSLAALKSRIHRARLKLAARVREEVEREE